MQYEVVTTPKFEKDIKHYKKKFKSVADDVDEIVEELEKGNLQGTVIPNLEMKDNKNNIVKVRIANSDTKSGKSNGYRLIYYAEKSDGTIYFSWSEIV